VKEYSNVMWAFVADEQPVEVETQDEGTAEVAVTVQHQEVAA